jgi:hypothetical protein
MINYLSKKKKTSGHPKIATINRLQRCGIPKYNDVVFIYLI